MTDIFLGHRADPLIPLPAKKEVAVTEHLVHPVDTRLRTKKVTPEAPGMPRFSRLYDSLRTEQGWRYCADALVTGSALSVAAGSTITPVTLAQPPNWRLSQWPDGVQLYLVVNGWGYAQEAAIATIGSLIVQFQAKSGATVLLSTGQTNTPGVNSEPDIIIPQPLTDPGDTHLGSLVFTLAPGGASTIVVDWAIQFATAYLLPSPSPFVREEKHHAYDSYESADQRC